MAHCRACLGSCGCRHLRGRPITWGRAGWPIKTSGPGFTYLDCCLAYRTHEDTHLDSNIYAYAWPKPYADFDAYA